MPTLAVFPLARQIIKREMAAATYRSSSAYLAKVISTIPLTVLGSLLLTIPVYWMIGLQNNLEKYLLFNIIVVVHSLTANSLGIAIGSIVPSVQVGQIIGPIFISILLLFGGQIVNLETLPGILF